MSNQANTQSAIAAMSTALAIAAKSQSGQAITMADLAPLTQIAIAVAGTVATPANPIAGAAVDVALAVAQTAAASDPVAAQTAMQAHMQALANLYAKMAAQQAAQPG